MRKILLTGATSGLGSEILKMLNNSTDEFYLQYFSEDKYLELQNTVSSLSCNATFFKTDLTDKEETDKMVKSILESGGVDTIIHCVSLPLVRDNLSKKSWSDFENHLNLQVRSLFIIVKGLIDKIKEKKKGKIINILSESVLGNPPSNLADYVTAKYALLGFSKSIAIEYGKSGITCNCISPGMVDTSLTAEMPDKLKQLVAMQTPLGRITKPRDVASIVKFLCSEEADFITGENIVVNGGFLMH